MAWTLDSSSSAITHVVTGLCLDTSQPVLSACPCSHGQSQLWTLPLSDNSLLKSADGICVSSSLQLQNCLTASTQWTSYHEFGDGVTFESTTSTVGHVATTLLEGSYPSAILGTTGSDSFSIPPGFNLLLNMSDGTQREYTTDIQLSLAAVNALSVNRLAGAIAYQDIQYTAQSFFINMDNSTLSSTLWTANSIKVAHSLVADIVLGSSRTNLIDSIASISATLNSESLSYRCNPACSSGGMCSINGTCLCKSGFAGPQCDRCTPGFFGPSCSPCSCRSNTTRCDDCIQGSGICNCADGFTGLTCSTCLPGYYGKSCQPCNCGGHGTCDAVTGKCSCAAGYALPNCTSCSAGFVSAGNSSCLACGSGCRQCSSSSTCTQCQSGLVLNAASGQCVSVSASGASSATAAISCPNGQYLSNGNCVACDPSCLSCFGPSPSQCLSCQPGTTYLLSGFCLGIQADGTGRCQASTLSLSGQYIANNVQTTCDPCPSTCATCSIPSFSNSSLITDVVCNSCLPGYVLDGGKCVANCSSGKYADASTSFTCQGCDASCSSCTGPTPNQCISCSNLANVVINGTCNSTVCPLEGFYNANGTCLQCHPDCATCSGPTLSSCTACPTLRPAIHNGQCLEVCPIGTVSTTNGTCQSCDATCSTCIGVASNQCLTCSDPKSVVIGGMCTSSCPTGQYVALSEGMCLPVLIAQKNMSPSPVSADPKWRLILLLLLLFTMLILVLLCIIRRRNRRQRKEKTMKFANRMEMVGILFEQIVTNVQNKVQGQSRIQGIAKAIRRATIGKVKEQDVQERTEWEARQKAWSLSVTSEVEHEPPRSMHRRIFSAAKRASPWNWLAMRWFGRGRRS